MANEDGLAEAAAWVTRRLRYERWLDDLVEASGTSTTEPTADDGDREVPRSA